MNALSEMLPTDDCDLYRCQLEHLLALELADIPLYEERIGQAVARAMMLAHENANLALDTYPEQVL